MLNLAILFMALATTVTATRVVVQDPTFDMDINGAPIGQALGLLNVETERLLCGDIKMLPRGMQLVRRRLTPKLNLTREHAG